MTEISVNDYQREVDCTYDDERYSVRDNGAVMRHPRAGKRPRPTDNQWTFGKPNSQNGYMYISQVRIHRIVATAFHGEPPTPEHVVDHIDTNRRNNRPENLRWLTRLENALLNPITVSRIEFICGSIETFLADPSILRHGSLDRNFEWMRTVSPEEAQKIADEAGAQHDYKIMDESGKIGQAYGAQTTPHMYVIDGQGTLVYAGAIDDNPSPRHNTVEGANNYVLAAMENLKAGEPVATPTSQPYGCAVKYKK